ncbi:MAG: hypothetical protein U1F48_08015 [Burkholderiales bacterium]
MSSSVLIVCISCLARAPSCCRPSLAAWAFVMCRARRDRFLLRKSYAKGSLAVTHGECQSSASIAMLSVRSRIAVAQPCATAATPRAARRFRDAQPWRRLGGNNVLMAKPDDVVAARPSGGGDDAAARVRRRVDA